MDDAELALLLSLSDEPELSTGIQCQICTLDLNHFTIKEREEHYERHFREDPQDKVQASSSRPSSSKREFNYKKRDKFKPKVPWHLEKDEAPFWYASSTAPPPPNYVPGLIPLLQKALTKSWSQGKTQRAVLCTSRAVHISRTWDAMWGCGYRTFMMVCAALMEQTIQPSYHESLLRLPEPGVRNLQRWLETAWDNGFDKDGAKDLRPIIGSSKWIGTADLATAFACRGIPTKLVDFDFRKSDRDLHLLTDWIVNYFTPSASGSPSNVNDLLRGASPVRVTDKMPLILQHSGHSRTIVGYEILKGSKMNILTFDSSRQPSKAVRKAAVARLTSSSASESPSLTGGKRRMSNAPSMIVEAKRSRSENDDDEVIILGEKSSNHTSSSSSSKRPLETDDFPWGDVTKSVRLDSEILKSKSQYQILYFPLAPLLTESEKVRYKVVRSEKIV